MTTNTYRQNGCNRGGRDHALQLVRKLPDAITRSLQVELVDRERGRAAALAPLLSARGLPVRVHETGAPLASSATVDVYSVDEVEVTARAVEGQVTSSLLEVALLVSVPTVEGVGGVVLALAATITPEAPAVRQAAQGLLGRIAALTPGRQSSALMAAHRVHAGQMPGARHTAHDRLTTQSARFLATGQADPELVLVDGFTRTPYRVTVLDARRETPRRVLRQAALQEVLPQVSHRDETQGVVFYERQDPWLYVVLARRRADRWHLDRAIELPVTMPEPEQAAIEVPTFVTD